MIGGRCLEVIYVIKLLNMVVVLDRWYPFGAGRLLGFDCTHDQRFIDDVTIMRGGVTNLVFTVFNLITRCHDHPRTPKFVVVVDR